MSMKTPQKTEWDDLAAQHDTLGHLLEAMGNTLVERKASRVRVEELLAELREVVRAHFVDEEDGGFFDKIIAEAPRLERQAKGILQEHQQLTKRLERMSELARSDGKAGEWWSNLETEFAGFSKRFHDHEEKENGLLQETYSRDIGAED